MATKKAKKINPFTASASKSPAKSGSKLDVLNTPKDISKAVDSFKKLQSEIKHLEGEATLVKNQVTDFARDRFAERVLNDKYNNFKLQGTDQVVSFIAQDASAGLSEDDVDQIKEEFGSKAAKALVVDDLSSLRFNPETLNDNFDMILKALQTLPNEILDNLFKPMLKKASPEAVKKATSFAKDQDELKRLIQLLKIKNYIR